MSTIDVSHRPVAYISIGNTDNELSQQRWATFSAYVRSAISTIARDPGGEIVFEGYSLPNAPHQNACWGLALPFDQERVAMLKQHLAELGRYFDQDSVAWALAPATEFLGQPQPAAAAA